MSTVARPEFAPICPVVFWLDSWVCSVIVFPIYFRWSSFSSRLVLAFPNFDLDFDLLVRFPLRCRSSGIVATVPKLVRRAISSLLIWGYIAGGCIWRWLLITNSGDNLRPLIELDLD